MFFILNVFVTVALISFCCGHKTCHTDQMMNVAWRNSINMPGIIILYFTEYHWHTLCFWIVLWKSTKYVPGQIEIFDINCYCCQCCHTLSSLIIVFAPSVQEGLIALWDCDESKDEAMADETQDMPAGLPKPQVDKLWHRITEERMVVGVILTTDSSM